MSIFHEPEICRSILESLQVGVCVVDLENRIVYWSAGAERITGYLRHEMVGHACVGGSRLHCDHVSGEVCTDECPLTAAIHLGKAAEASSFVRHKSGHTVPLHIRAVPVRNAHGSIIGAVESFEDHSPSEDVDRGERRIVPGCLDEVTGIANHAWMQSHLREALGTYVELQVPFAVLCFRLEGLEKFRASFGREAERLMLRMVAHSIEGSLWRTDVVGRWSDDQFLAILNGCEAESLHRVRDRICRMLASEGIEWWGERHSLPVSVGEAGAKSGDTMESILKRVQKSMEGTSGARAAAAHGQNSSGS
jgi:diguanylate cyclase (GGDEF)-like protein